jgi:hypothetical protein
VYGCTIALSCHASGISLPRSESPSWRRSPPGWFVREKAASIPTHLGGELRNADVRGEKVHLTLANGTSSSDLVVDHVIGGTGYCVALERLRFPDDEPRKKIHTAEDIQVLNTHFESSVPGLYFVGVATANSFGPLRLWSHCSRHGGSQSTRVRDTPKFYASSDGGGGKNSQLQNSPVSGSWSQLCNQFWLHQLETSQHSRSKASPRKKLR